LYFPQIPKNSNDLGSDQLFRVSHQVMFLLIGALILYLVPANEVLELPLVGSSIEIASNLIPSVAEWVKLSPFPAATRLFFVYVWMSIPIRLLIMLNSKQARDIFYTKIESRRNSQLFFDSMRVGLVLFPLLVLGFMFAIVDSPPCRVCVNSERWAQLFIGSFFAIVVSGLAALVIWYLCKLQLRNSRGGSNV